MNVLTWNGAVVCADMSAHRLVQVPLWQPKNGYQSFDFDANALYPRHELLGGFHVDPGPRRRTIHIRRGSLFLGVDPARQELLMAQENAGEAETFLLLEAGELADLRHIFERRWLVGGTGARVRKSAIFLRPGFHLHVGPAAADLTTALPLQSPARFLLAEGGTSPRLGYAPPEAFLLRDADGGGTDIEFEADAHAEPHEVRLRPLDGNDNLKLVGNREDFATGRNCRIVERAAEPIFAMPPLMMCDADRLLFVNRQWRGGMPGIGQVTDGFSVRRESQRYVALMRGAEGVSFSADGGTHEPDPLAAVENLPRGFSRNKRGMIADLDYLSEMPRLPGSYFIFFDRKLHNWFHWLAGAMLALDMAEKILPPRTKLLLPPTLMQFDHTAPGYFDHFELMSLLGFDKLPAVEAVTETVHVEEAVALETNGPESLPAQHLCAFRDRIMARFGPRSARRRRLFVKRAGARAIDQPSPTEAFLARKDFEPVQLDGMPIEERIRLFQEADIVVGAHGAELANLLFSPPGTKVIELMPDYECRPAIWSMANKLGHVHAMLGCPTHDGTFDGRLVVDIKRLAAIHRMVTSYR
jgi:hypothetical protein